MLNMKIAADNAALAELQYHLAKLGQGSMPSTAGAMSAGASLVRDTWKGFAMGGTLPGIAQPLKNPNGGYARSIRTEKIGQFEHDIYSEAAIAGMIESGTKALDMKTTHPFGPRSRMSKEGFPYLIIPFRWGTPEGKDGKRVGFKNIMTSGIYSRVKNKRKFRQTKVLKTTHNEPNYSGQQVSRADYNGADGKGGWGDSLDLDIGDDANAAGMSSMVGQDGKAAGYFTFRVISAKQLITRPYSWIKPAMPARPVTRAVADVTRPTIDAMVETAIMEDLGA